MVNRLERQALDLLAGDCRDEVEVSVHVEHPPTIDFRACRDQKICNRCGSVRAVGEKCQLNLSGTIFNSGSHVVLDKITQESVIQLPLCLLGVSKGIANFQGRHRGKGHKASLNSL